jgi:hypothetical protein
MLGQQQIQTVSELWFRLDIKTRDRYSREIKLYSWNFMIDD